MFNSNPYFYGNNFNQQRFQQQNQNTVQTQCFSIIPVTSEQEATAYRVDMFGMPTFFYNSATNEVYLKRINTQNGNADFIKFARIEKANNIYNEQIETNEYMNKLNSIEHKLNCLLPMNEKGAKEDDKPITTNANATKF